VGKESPDFWSVKRIVMTQIGPPQPHRSWRLGLGIAVVCLAVAAVAALVPIDHTLSCSCVLDASHRWTFAELRPGTFVSRSVDNIVGQTLQFRLFQFDRPAFLDINFASFDHGDDAQAVCAEGQLLASVGSSALNIEMAERSSDLHRARAVLEGLRGGAKPELIEHAQIAVEHAQTELANHESVYHRQRQLNEQDLISAGDWEEAAARYELLKVDLQLAEANLRVLQSDARPEDIAAAEVTVTACEQELAAVRTRLTAQDIVAPMSGRFHVGTTGTALLSITRLDTLVIRALIPQSSGHLPQVGQRIRTYIPGTGTGRLDGRIERIDRRTVTTPSGPYLTVYGVLVNPSAALDEGMEGRAKIYCGRTTLLAKIWQDVVTAWHRELMPI